MKLQIFLVPNIVTTSKIAIASELQNILMKCLWNRAEREVIFLSLDKNLAELDAVLSSPRFREPILLYSLVHVRTKREL